jgi:hypothetical protein
MLKDHGSSWNPNVIGPLDRCLRCWMPIAQDLAYCATCGHVSLIFNSLPMEWGERCCFHSNHAAEWTCCLCRRPICKECCAHETNPFTTFGPLWHCRQCIDDAKAIDARFFKTLAATNCCVKHRDVAMAFKCKKCALPLCSSCTYFTVRGILKRRPINGPFCLACFQMATLGNRWSRWFSGHDVAPGIF